ncbi:hypothetical protein D3C81_1844880 [compost metagenome]
MGETSLSIFGQLFNDCLDRDDIGYGKAIMGDGHGGFEEIQMDMDSSCDLRDSSRLSVMGYLCETQAAGHSSRRRFQYGERRRQDSDPTGHERQSPAVLFLLRQLP